MSTVFALIARIHGTYANRNIMADTYALIVLKGEEMKRKKPNFWRLLPKSAPYILAFMFWRYSNLGMQDTITIILASVTCYVLIMMATDAWVGTEENK